MIGHPGRAVTYCTNIHPTDDWNTTFAALREHIPQVKQALAPDHAFPVGLRLSSSAALELDANENRRFSAWLREHDCYVPTLNGFPYGNFHAAQVKEGVYLPDWRSPERTAYTLRLAELLADWLPANCCGSISTVPIGFKEVVSLADLPSIRREITTVLTRLAELQQTRGVEILLALEPEPGCLLETTDEVCRFFELLALPAELRNLLGLCYDCCHQAVEFEDPADSLGKLARAGIRIAKVQVSSALSISAPSPQWLQRFDEPTYLHQVVVRGADGRLQRYKDLPEAFVAHQREPGDEWRCHFHVPIFIASMDDCGTTRAFIENILPLLPQELLLEVETYTWNVLPADLRCTTVTESIIRELRWLEAEIRA